MKQLFSVNYKEWAFNLMMLILRVGAGLMMIPHGYNKLVNFVSYKAKFMNFMGIGQTASLSLAIFAEFFCAVLLIMGLFSRMVALILTIVMGVALFMAHNGDIFGKGEMAGLYMIIFIAILLCGPGKASIDSMIK